MAGLNALYYIFMFDEIIKLDNRKQVTNGSLHSLVHQLKLSDKKKNRSL